MSELPLFSLAGLWRLCRALVLVLPVAITGCGSPDRGVAGHAPDTGTGVTVSEVVVSLPSYVSEPRYLTQGGSNAAFYPKAGSQRPDGGRALRAVVLENEFIRVNVIPELGGVIERAVYKPTQDDFFFREGKIKDWLPFWESGVKPSFPWHEHGLRTDQPASWRIVSHPDGSRTIAMWMEFSRYTGPENRWQFGRFSNLLFSQFVTLRPGDTTFTVTYRATNPSAYRQGRRIWNDTLYPRHQTAQRTVQGDQAPEPRTDTELIYPAPWVSNHHGADLHELRPSEIRIADYAQPHNSLFAWDIRHGFAGLWYPQPKISRLRLWNPAEAPGAKVYLQGEGGFRSGGPASHMYNFIELWGGSDSVFEGVEEWLEPGHAYQFTHRFALVPGMGKTSYANDRLAIHADFREAPTIELFAFRPGGQLEAEWDGDLLADYPPAQPVAPRVLSVGLPAGTESGRLVVRQDGSVIADVALPLAIDFSSSRHDRIKQANATGSPEYEELAGDSLVRGSAYRNALGRGGYPAGSTGRGRLLYRDGQVPAARDCLALAVASDPGDGEAWHLLGVSHLELGALTEARACLAKATVAARPYPHARYYEAILLLSEGKRAGAEDSLRDLLAARPAHYEARLLLGYLEATRQGRRAPARAEALAEEDPADPRALWVLSAAKPTDASLSAVLAQMVQEPGAKARLDEFVAATRGRFVAPKRMLSAGRKSPSTQP